MTARRASSCPNTNSTTARVKVEAVGNIFFDISNADFSITKAAATVDLASSANPSVHGQSVDFTASVASIGGSPSGAVQFAIDGFDVDAPVTLAGGQAVYSTSSLSTGAHTVTASYAGDDGFSSAVSDPLNQQVNKADTDTSVISNADPSVTGQDATFTATVSASAPGDGTPTGNVQFSVDGTDVGTPVALNGVGQATSAAISDMSVGSHTIGAAYAGDGDFNSSSGSVGQSVDKADTTTAITNGGALGSDSVVGQEYTVEWSVTVNAPGTGSPTGTVEVTGGSGCSAAVAAGQCTLVSTEAGAKTLIASYSGDDSFNESTSESGAHNVNLADSTTNVGSSANPSVHGQSVSFTATVSASAPGAGLPTGNVQFQIDGSDFGSPASLNGSGVATSDSISSLLTSGHTIGAIYAGDTHFNSSSGNLSQTVNKASSATAVSSSANPSVHGQSVSFTATVTSTAPGAGIPGGLVQFKVDGTNLGSPVALDGSGQATSPSTSAMSTAGHSVTAIYGGATDYNGSTSPSLSQVVGKANSAISVSSLVNPSVHGQSVSFKATVVAGAPGSGTPTGQVQFKVDNKNLGSPVTLSGGMATSPAISSLKTKSHKISANYLGNADFKTSSSANLTHVVNKASSSTVVSASPEPSRFGNSFTLKATVSAVAPGAGTAAGKIQFYIDGAKFRGSVKLHNGQASLVVNIALTRGNHSIQARYLGSKDFLASASPMGTHSIH